MVGTTVSYRNSNSGAIQFSTRRQAGQQVFYDHDFRRIGYIDSTGRTFSQDNHVLNAQARPDLILARLTRKP